MNTQEVIEGTKDYNKDVTYLIKFVKKGEKQEKIKCKGCGAEIELNSIGKCEYCGNYECSDKYDWVVDDIKILT